jgi:hypothetical protein
VIQPGPSHNGRNLTIVIWVATNREQMLVQEQYVAFHNSVRETDRVESFATAEAYRIMVTAKKLPSNLRSVCVRLFFCKNLRYASDESDRKWVTILWIPVKKLLPQMQCPFCPDRIRFYSCANPEERGKTPLTKLSERHLEFAARQMGLGGDSGALSRAF